MKKSESGNDLLSLNEHRYVPNKQKVTRATRRRTSGSERVKSTVVEEVVKKFKPVVVTERRERERKKRKRKRNRDVTEWSEEGMERMDIETLREVLGMTLSLYGFKDIVKEELMNVVENKARELRQIAPEEKVKCMESLQECYQKHIATIKMNEYPLRRIQSHFRSYVVQEHVRLINTSAIKKSCFVKILNAEKNQIALLACIVKEYQMPLLKAHSSLGIDTKTVNEMFSQMASLLNMSKKFYRNLKALTAYYPLVINVGDTFLKFAPKFYHYVVYVTNLNSTVLKIKHLRSYNPYFDDWIEKTRKTSSFPDKYLSELLREPSTQMSLYEKYLTEMINGIKGYYKSTSTSELQQYELKKVEYEDLNSLREAASKVSQLDTLISNTLNENNLAVVQYIEDQLVGLDIILSEDPNRTFIREGDIILKNRIRKYYLFNDIFILADPSKKGHEDKVILTHPIHDIKILSGLKPGTDDLAGWVNFTIKLHENKDYKKELLLYIDVNDSKFYDNLKTQIEICNSQDRVYGVRLRYICERESTVDHIPDIVKRITDYLGRDDIAPTTGIFRKNGNATLIDDWMKRTDAGEIVDIEKDCHSASGLLKLFFRMLPEPLFTYELYYPLLEFVPMYDSLPKEESLTHLKKLLSCLPLENLKLLSYLCGFLSTVASHSDSNLMTQENLAIVFAANLLQPEVETKETTFHSGKVNRVMHIILQNYTILSELLDTDVEFFLRHDDGSRSTLKPRSARSNIDLKKSAPGMFYSKSMNGIIDENSERVERSDSDTDKSKDISLDEVQLRSYGTVKIKKSGGDNPQRRMLSRSSYTVNEKKSSSKKKDRRVSRGESKKSKRSRRDSATFV